MTLDLDRLEALTKEATPTPWYWAGNTDQEDPRIEGGPRRHYVMGVVRREREKDDRQTRDFERYMQEVEQFDPSLNDGKGGYRYLTEQEIADAVKDDWLSEPNGEPRYDDRLSFINVDTHLMEYARDLAVYAVCPDAKSRDDERVYRADITGVRNPNAELMIEAVNALPLLLEEVRQLREQVAAVGEANIHLNARLGEVKRERDLAVAHDRQPYPTAHAYEAACRALEKHRQDAKLLAEERDQVLALLDEITKMSTIPGGDLHAAANWKASDTFDTIRAIFSVSRTPHEAQHG